MINNIYVNMLFVLSSSTTHALTKAHLTSFHYFHIQNQLQAVFSVNERYNFDCLHSKFDLIRTLQSLR